MKAERPTGWSALAAVCALVCTAGCGDRTEAPARPPAPDAAPPPPPERVVRVLHGNAVWYGGDWHGKKTASGETFDEQAFTAAHRTLPLGTRVRVTALDTGKQVILRINDRGPYGPDRHRIIDVSEAAARELGFLERGWARVKIEVLAPLPDAASAAP